MNWRPIVVIALVAIAAIGGILYVTVLDGPSSNSPKPIPESDLVSSKKSALAADQSSSVNNLGATSEGDATRREVTEGPDSTTTDGN